MMVGLQFAAVVVVGIVPMCGDGVMSRVLPLVGFC